MSALLALGERALDFGHATDARVAYRMVSVLRWEEARFDDAERASESLLAIGRAGNSDERARAMAEAGHCLALARTRSAARRSAPARGSGALAEERDRDLRGGLRLRALAPLSRRGESTPCSSSRRLATSRASRGNAAPSSPRSPRSSRWRTRQATSSARSARASSCDSSASACARAASRPSPAVSRP